MNFWLWLWPIIFAALFVFPPVVRGSRATSNPIRITRPEGPINWDGSVTAFAHVQEKGEFRLFKLAALVAGLAFPLSGLVEGTIYAALVQGIVMFIADQIARNIPVTDIGGHLAEIMAAEAAGDMAYREQEASRMAAGEYRGRDVPALLAKWAWLGRIVYALGRW